MCAGCLFVVLSGGQGVGTLTVGHTSIIFLTRTATSAIGMAKFLPEATSLSPQLHMPTARQWLAPPTPTRMPPEYPAVVGALCCNPSSVNVP